MAGKIWAWRGLASVGVAAVTVVGVTILATPALASAATSLPGPPGTITAVARDQGALVNWTAPTSNGGSRITGYVVTVTPGGQTATTAAVTSFLVGGLANGTACTFTVAAVNKSGTGPASSPSAAVTPKAPVRPGRPGSVVASAGFGQVTVTWAAPKSDGGAPVTGYRLTTNPTSRTVTVTGDARSATLSGLTDGTAYQVSVAAVNSAGHGGATASASVTPQLTAPGPPTGVTAAPVDSGVVVSWEPPLSNGGSAVTGYLVTVVGTTQTVSASASAVSATVTGLTNGTTYTFQVLATNAQGQGAAQTSTPATAGGTTGSSTVVLSAASLASLSQVGTDGSLLFTNPPAQVQGLSAGDIVVAGVSPATPQGLLATVTAASATGSTVTVSTAPASLDDALSAAGFGTSTTLTQKQVAAFTPARRGVRLLPPGQAPASARLGSIGLSLDTTLYKSADGRTVTINGDLSVSPSVSFAAQISCCFHTASQFTGSVTASASLSVTAQVSHDISGGYTLGTFKFTPIAFDVLGVPVVIVPKLTVKLIAKGSVTAGVTAGAGASVTVGAQVTTQDSQVSASPFVSHTASFTPPTLYGTLDAAGGVEADLSATVDGVAGVTLTDSLWVAELSVDLSRNPWWTLSLENELDLDFDLTLLDHTLADYQKTLSDITVRLAQAASPYQGVSITPDPATVAPGGTLQLSAHVARVAAQSVTWNAPPGNGTITSSGLYTAPTAPGDYQVTATQPASGLSPQAVGLTTVQVGDQPPGPPTNPSATANSDGTATVTWTPPADTGGGAITSYTVTAEPGGLTDNDPGSATSDTFAGLAPGGTYTFTVTAASDGGTSLPSPSTNPVEIANTGSGGGTDWTPTQAPLPPNAGTNPMVDLQSVACPAAGECVAAGGYADVNFLGDRQGLLLSESGSSWSATEAPLPLNASGNQSVDLTVACASTTSCAAVGFYHDSGNDFEGLLETGSGSSWTGAQAPLPTNAAPEPGQDSDLMGVACAPGDACVATGFYTDSSGNQQGLLVTGSGTSWTAIQAPLPPNAASSPVAGIGAVTCPSSGSCVATGSYTDSSGNQQGLLVTGWGTSWTATEAPLPANAASDPSAGVHSAACSPAGPCVAEGGYTDSSSGYGQSLVETGSGTSWTPTQGPLPAGALGGGPQSVACPSTTCTMAGTYTDSTRSLEGILVSGSGTTWTATEAPLPADAQTGSGHDATLQSVACPSATSCVSVGGYVDSAGNAQEVLETGSGAAWAPTQAPLPANANWGGNLMSVACADMTSCVAVGTYTDSSIHGQGLLLTGPG